jgi:N-acyl-D-aspartate/D-glutamate deacylase
MLTHWVRDRTRGDRLPLEAVIKMQTQNTAEAYGLLDRGVLKKGMKADVNLIDLEKLTLHAPQAVKDLPASGRRLIQKVDGYKATIQSGQITYLDGVATGNLPGRLIRGPQARV